MTFRCVLVFGIILSVLLNLIVQKKTIKSNGSCEKDFFEVELEYRSVISFYTLRERLFDDWRGGQDFCSGPEIVLRNILSLSIFFSY